MDFEKYKQLREVDKLNYLYFAEKKRFFRLSDLLGLFGLVAVVSANLVMLTHSPENSSFTMSDFNAVYTLGKWIILFYILVFVWRLQEWAFVLIEEREYWKSIDK